MAHELTRKDTMFAVGEAPWHRLGTVLEEPPTIDEAIRVAGLNWTVGMKPLFTQDGIKAPALATFREDTGDILGIVGESYKPLQNAKAFEFFQPFLENKLASLETAGSLKGNRLVWVLAKINKDPSVISGSDVVDKYVLLSNSHDGTLAVRVGFTPIRVVCNNTLTLAINSKASRLIRVKHTQSVNENLDKIQDIINVADAEFEATAEQFRLLTKKDINQDDIKKFVKLVFATKDQMDRIMKGEDIDAGRRVRDDITRLFETGRGSDLPGAKGTLWGLYNATTEYIQYERGTDAATRLNETWFGTGAELNRKALQTAVVLAAA